MPRLLHPGSQLAIAMWLVGGLGASPAAPAPAPPPPTAPTSPAAIVASDSAELERRLAAARPGDRILLASGSYRGLHVAGLRGQQGRPVVIAAADPRSPPTFAGGVHLSDAAHVTIEHVVIAGTPSNGLNIDDGGSFESPSHHVLLRHLTVRDCGGRGNDDGIKLSGVVDFAIEDSTVEGWGRGGSAVDLVGCHRGRIEGCTFRDRPDDPPASGVQVKGGSGDILVRACRFEHAGQRAVNLGGATGLPYFRPPLDGPGTTERAEARNVTVEDCTFIGSAAPIAFVGVDGAAVRRNTIYRPQTWIIRILQETREPGFVPCRNGVFAENLVVHRVGDLRSAVNVGPGTAPETFRFERNFWFAEDAPGRSMPALPVPERDGAGGEDPLFRDAAAGDLRLREGSPAAGRGATAP